MVKLKHHLLPRIVEIHATNSASDGDTNPTLLAGLNDGLRALPAAPDHVILKNHRIYRHQILRINYTTYDVRRTDDIFNPNTEHCDIMLLHRSESGDSEDRHRFCYGRIIGVYHANVQYIGPGMKDYLPRRMDFLHVRWLERVPQQDLHGLEALQFTDTGDPATFDFVDPADVLRGCHLIPAFKHGKLQREHDAMLPASIAGDSEDWNYYYINRYGSLLVCGSWLTLALKIR